MYVLNVEQYLVWYYIFISVVLLLTFWASYRHSTAVPFMWGLIVSLVLLALVNYVEPILFGWMAYYNVNWYAFALMGGFAILWFGYVLLTIYNCMKYGNVVE